MKLGRLKIGFDIAMLILTVTVVAVELVTISYYALVVYGV